MAPIDRLLASRAATPVPPVTASPMASDDRSSDGRSLIPQVPQPSLPSVSRPTGPSAAFLAQLIAIKQQAPQTRERRRTNPEDASAAYGYAGQAAAGAQTGRLISRAA